MAGTPFYRGFLKQVPKELEESMYLDGATRFQTLLHCIIPLSKPAIATQAVLAFNGYWSNLFDILTFTKSDKQEKCFPLHCNRSVDSIRRTMA